MPSSFLFTCITLLTITTLGCGKKMEEASTKATGKVTLDGKPVTVGTISFYPTGGGNSAFAIIDSDGSFTVNTSAGTSGLEPGTYKAVISYTPEPTVGADGVETPGTNPIPEKYRDEEKPIIDVTIPESGDDNLVIELKS